MTTSKYFTTGWIFVMASVATFIGIARELIERFDLGEGMIILVGMITTILLYGFLRYGLDRLAKYFEN